MGAAASSVGTAKHGGAMVQMLLQVLQMGSSLSKDPTQHCAQPCGFSLGFLWGGLMSRDEQKAVWVCIRSPFS